MLGAFVLMQLGIFADYWPTFSTETWAVHVHYWTASAWYVFLIFQPYLATHGRLSDHRTNGIIGFFLAGGVGVTALSMLHRDIVYAELAVAQPDRFGPFEPWFFMGILTIELVLVSAFLFAIIMSILRRKVLEDHAWWLISTVFIILMPALARGIQNLHFAMNIEDWPDVPVMPSIYLTQLLIIGLVLFMARRYQMLTHRATWLAVAVNAFVFLLEPIGRNEAWQEILKSLVKG